MTGRRWLLVHPPLLGPAVMGPLAGELRRRGREVRVPDLRDCVNAAPGWYDRWTERSAAEGDADVVVGFSGAGVTLPSVSAAVGARRVVWVDAVVPATAGATVASAEMRELVRPLVRGDRIAEWTTWWGPGALEELLPDPALLSAIRGEGHELPAEFYEVPVPVPDVWPDDDVRYVQLSPAYDSDAERARARGWSVIGEGSGGHLDVAAKPATVADLLD